MWSSGLSDFGGDRVIGALGLWERGDERKPVSEVSEAQPLSKRAKAGKVTKKRNVKGLKQLVDEFVDEGVPAAKPSLEDSEEAILQKRCQKGKEKVGEEQAAQVLLNLQTPKKKSSAQQYILQRHTPVPHESADQETSSLYAELGLSGSDTESDEEMPSVGRSGKLDEGQAGSDLGTRDEGQAGSNPGTLDEGQAGSGPGTRDEGQAGPNPDDTNIAESLPLPTPSVLAGPNLELSDVEITGPSSQPQPEHMDEGFTASAYPDVHKNLKLTVDEQRRQLADTEAESMASVAIQQDTSITPPITSPVIDLVSRPHSPNVHWPLPTTTITTAATTTTTLPLPPQLQQGSSESLLIKRMGELEQHIADRVDENQA
ncbi:hypothetical protein Tco_0153480 [Tanacetum coccineum]